MSWPSCSKRFDYEEIVMRGGARRVTRGRFCGSTTRSGTGSCCAIPTSYWTRTRGSRGRRTSRTGRGRIGSTGSWCWRRRRRSGPPRRSSSAARSGLADLERAFRTMKSSLDRRPLFHRVDRRIEAHVFLCVIWRCRSTGWRVTGCTPPGSTPCRRVSWSRSTGIARSRRGSRMAVRTRRWPRRVNSPRACLPVSAFLIPRSGMPPRRSDLARKGA